MSIYIPLIKNTRWIDLSPEHKELRKELENDIKDACVKKEHIQPIMLQGAFGIGKTNSLYYLFHLGWCTYKIPVFFVSLGGLIQLIKIHAEKQPLGKIDNSRLGFFINQILKEQIEILKSGDWSNIQEIFFAEFNGGDLNKYLEGFKPVEVIDSNKESNEFQNNFSEETIKNALSSRNRPLLLIDEFESDFYELKKYIETSGGGILRELFDQVVKDLDMFYLIIGNGPASGYEIAKERGEDSVDSETAGNRRLKTKAIPFPTANLLSRSFLKGDPKGYINFIWWLSRCRPGHVLKLRDSLGAHEELLQLTFSELIIKKIFKEPIDEGGEEVTYLKTDFFNQIPGEIHGSILNKLIISFSPQEIDIQELPKELTIIKKCVKYFYCSSELVNVEKIILPALNEDLYNKNLYDSQKNGQYERVNYIEHIQPYFSYILNAISDENGNLAFGMIGDSNPNDVLAEIFLIPLMELTYDFISLYEDDSLKEIKQTLDFLLNVINQITKSEEFDDIFPTVSETFNRCKLKNNTKVFLQLSIYSIRESIEQPIGSPRLPYKTKKMEALFDELPEQNKLPIILHNENKLNLYFIPLLNESLLKKYREQLEEHVKNNFIKEEHEKGEIVTRFICFEKNDDIEDFKKYLTVYEKDVLEPAYLLKKIDIVNIDSYQLNFSSQIKDYIDSVAKIGILGRSYDEISDEDITSHNGYLDIKEIINIIGKRPWTEKKETIRTIEHYKKMLFEGDNSVINIIQKESLMEYESTLSKKICNRERYLKSIEEYSYFVKIVSNQEEDYDSFTKQIAIMTLLEENSNNDDLKALLKLIRSDFQYSIQKDNPNKLINFSNFLNIISKNTTELEKYNKEFEPDAEFILALKKLASLLLRDYNVCGITEFNKYLNETKNLHFIKSYHLALGGEEENCLLLQCCFYIELLKKIGLVSLKEKINQRIQNLEDRLKNTRVNIIDKLTTLENLLNNKENKNYINKLNKAMQGLTLVKKMASESKSLTIFVIINTFLEYLDETEVQSQNLLEHVEEIIESVKGQKEKVDELQESINNYYSDTLTEKLLDFKYWDSRKDNYLWEKEFLQNNLKNKKEYQTLFEYEFKKIDPFTYPTVGSDKIEELKECLDRLFTYLKPNIDDTLKDIINIYEDVQESKELKSFIEELLNVNAK